MTGGQGPYRPRVCFAAVHTFCLLKVPCIDVALLIPRQQMLAIWCEGQAGDLQLLTAHLTYFATRSAQMRAHKPFAGPELASHVAQGGREDGNCCRGIYTPDM